MKIGIVTSGHEMLPLFDVLKKHQHEYHVFRDRAYRPRGDKSFQLVHDRIAAGITQLIAEAGVEALILPPVREVQALQKWLFNDVLQNIPVLPLFSTYVREHAFRHSIIGKIGLLCDYADMDLADETIRLLEASYELTDNQRSIKTFHRPFALRKKEVRMRKYFLTTYGKRDRMVRKTIKYDLRYFKDAAVDTLIPMSRWMLFYQTMIKHMVSRKRMRFHGLEAVEASFATVTAWFSTSAYRVTFHRTGGEEMGLEREWEGAMRNEKWAMKSNI